MRMTVLGTGTSFGVPQVGCSCPVCRSDDPRDSRTRTSAVVEDGGRRILIDTPPELRLQLVRHGIDDIDAVLYTHDHADHVNGIDDLRALTARRKDRLQAHGPSDSMDRIASRFAYIFDPEIEAPPGTFFPKVGASPLAAGRTATIAGIEVLPIGFEHAGIPVFGYRFGPVAYVTDVKHVGEEAYAQLEGVRVIVLSALFEHTHPSHLSIPEAIAVAERLGVERMWLTHLTHHTSHRSLEERLPPEVRPAHDGLVIEMETL